MFLASHVVCSGVSALQFPLLKMLNDSSIDNPSILKTKSQSLEIFLNQCKDVTFVTKLLNQDGQIDQEEFKTEIDRKSVV